MDFGNRKDATLAKTEITFTKCEALRNDFCVVEPKRGFSWTPSRVQGICDRRSGVGADGLIVLNRRQGAFSFSLFNSDGTRAEWSGNGIRCAAAYVARKMRRKTAVFHTAAGAIETSMSASNRGVSVAFQRPLPVVEPVRSTHRLPAISGGRGPIGVDAGNPHWVFIVKDFDFNWEEMGRACQAAMRRTHGVNVEFVRIHTRKRIELRLYERGVGPTPSSGSGALAALAACLDEGLVADSLQIGSPGGAQSLTYHPRDGAVRLIARARVVHSGTWYNR